MTRREKAEWQSEYLQWRPSRFSKGRLLAFWLREFNPQIGVTRFGVPPKLVERGGFEA